MLGFCERILQLHRRCCKTTICSRIPSLRQSDKVERVLVWFLRKVPCSNDLRQMELDLCKS